MCEAIYFAGGLGCPLEYYQPGFRPWLAQRWNTADLYAFTAALHRFRTDPSGVFSVKLFWHGITAMVRELKPNEFARPLPTAPSAADAATYRRMFSALSDLFPAPSFVFLARRDEIYQAVSLYVAGATRAWRQYEGVMPNGDRTPPYDFDIILQLLARIQNHKAHWINFFRANELRYRTIYYEDLEQDYEGTLRKLFTAIGRPDAPIPPPRLQKQADFHSDALTRKFQAEFSQRAGG